MILEFSGWLQEDGVKNVLSLVYSVVDVIRYIVPIVLIIMTSIDISKKVIDPNEKEGQQKILRRALAAIIIFLIPILIKLVMGILGLETEEVVVDNTPTKTSTTISSLKITNCPTVSCHNGEKITLKVNVPNGYTDGIIWSVKSGINYITLTPSNDTKTAEIRFSNIYSKDKAEIKVSSGGKSDTCKINLDIQRIENLKFMNCPSEVKHPGDSFALKTNISTSYKEGIEWTSDNNYDVTTKYSMDRTDATVNINSVPSNGYVTIKVNAGGKEATCKLRIEKISEPSPSSTATPTVLSSISIKNCPSTTTYYNVGDKISLNTDIPQNFTGDIKWKVNYDSSAAKIKSSTNKKSIDIEILDQPKEGYIIFTVHAGGQATSCLINIAAVKKLEITNCPSKDRVFHVGDKITLNSNLPSYYKKDTFWNTEVSPNIFKITPINDGKSAEIEIIKVPDNKRGTIGLGADLKGTSCQITIEN